ncbi:hypothetical protein NDN08_006655 [Rhodosorus marinus]|uniref:Uncharacterized protein n=1 Tax=Rhodosorus marinus TaxID=101924 RepID=A0AAV8UKZ2_9RHOD|nr:hypothetical protein NDN08_006655 [Rhodosorus marinus]
MARGAGHVESMNKSIAMKRGDKLYKAEEPSTVEEALDAHIQKKGGQHLLRNQGRYGRGEHCDWGENPKLTGWKRD